jgi:hypothetical protein
VAIMRLIDTLKLIAGWLVFIKGLTEWEHGFWPTALLLLVSLLLIYTAAV